MASCPKLKGVGYVKICDSVPSGCSSQKIKSFKNKDRFCLMFASVFLSDRAKLGHGLLSGQYSKPPMKSELIEQVMKEEHKVLNGVCPALKLDP